MISPSGILLGETISKQSGVPQASHKWTADCIKLELRLVILCTTLLTLSDILTLTICTKSLTTPKTIH